MLAFSITSGVASTCGKDDRHGSESLGADLEIAGRCDCLARAWEFDVFTGLQVPHLRGFYESNNCHCASLVFSDQASSDCECNIEMLLLLSPDYGAKCMKMMAGVCLHLEAGGEFHIKLGQVYNCIIMLSLAFSLVPRITHHFNCCSMTLVFFA